MSNAEYLAVPGDQEIDLDRYAEVLAHTLHFRDAPSSEVRARLRVPETRWNEAHAKWTRVLVQEAADDEAPAARQFGAAFAKTRTRLREERTTLESLGSLPVVETARTPEPAVALAEPAPLVPSAPTAAAPPSHPRGGEVQVALPSYMLAASAPTPPPLAPAFAPLSTPPLLVHQPERVVPAQHPDLRATADTSDSPIRPAFPFQTGGTPEETLADVVARMTAAQGAPSAQVSNQPHAHLGETVGLAPFSVGMVLPFAADVAAPPTPSWMPAGMLKLVSVEGTQLSIDAPAEPALPFEPSKSPQLAFENALAQAARLQGPAPRPTKDPGLAGTMGPGSSLAMPKPELPFAAPSAPIPPQAPALSIERYASLCVELSATPANRGETLRRYQLNEPQRTTLDAHWKARITREPGMRATWENACSAYKTWLAQAGRGKE